MRRELYSSALVTFLCSAMIMTGCGSDNTSSIVASSEEDVIASEADTAMTDEMQGDTAKAGDLQSGASVTDAQQDSTSETSHSVVRVGSLKGPTTMGIVNLMNASENGQATGSYEFTMESDPSAIASEMLGGNLDIAMVPANLAATMYNKADGGIAVIDINTLGVLECVTGDDSIASIKDLAGKTVVTTGQGASPEYVMDYLLEQYGVTDCTLDFKSESTEVAAALKEDPDTIAVLPQPFATAAQMQNTEVKSVFSLSDEWDALDLSDGSRLLTGVTVVRSAFLEEYPAEVEMFLKEHAESADKANSDLEGTAALVANYGIVEKAAVAQKALPSCKIVCITGSEMKEAMEGYLQVLYDADPAAVGGALPGEDFYYTAK